jgi:cysteine desulfurase
MFGYVVANMEKLTTEEKQHYRSYYCGLCRSLGKHHGTLGRITLNYDMTFLVLFLSALYKTDNKIETERCIIHPFKPQKFIQNEITDYAAEHLDCSVSYLPVDSDGLIDPDDVKQAIRKDTALISIMHANNEVGTIEPVSEIAAIARDNGVPFHVDAVQSVGHIPIDVDQLGVDILSLSGHKFYGPKGVGALYVRKGTPFAPPLRGGGQERDYRSGTENIPGIVGLGQAAVIAQRDMGAEMGRLEGMRDALIRGIEEQIPGARLNGHRKNRLPHNVNIAFAGIEGESLVVGLDLFGIAISSGSACSTGDEEPSHVLRSLGLPDQYLNGAIRLSLGRTNAEEDISFVIEKLSGLVHKLTQFSPA